MDFLKNNKKAVGAILAVLAGVLFASSELASDLGRSICASIPAEAPPSPDAGE